MVALFKKLIILSSNGWPFQFNSVCCHCIAELSRRCV